MRGLALGLIRGAVPATVFALTSSETWLLRAAVILFVMMIVFCTVVWRQVSESSRIATNANDLATALDKRTADLVEQLGPRE